MQAIFLNFFITNVLELIMVKTYCNMEDPVACAENFHGGGFHSVAYGAGLFVVLVFVMSQFDVIFMFPNQRFGEVFWHNMHILLHALPLFYVSLYWI